MTNENALSILTLLSGLRGWPRSEGGRQALVLGALAFSSEQKFQKFVVDWMKHEQTAPMPADLFQAAGSTRGDGGLQRAHFGCTVCYDTGKTSAEFLVTWRHGGRKTSHRLTTEEAARILERHREAEKEAQALDRAGKGPEAKQIREQRTLRIGAQMIYEYPVACECQAAPARLPDAPPERERYV